MTTSRAFIGVFAVLGLAACSAAPPPRVAVELSARASAKAGVVSLVVSNPARAERLRAIYLEVVNLGRELDRARVLARAQCHVPSERALAATPSDPIGSGALGCLIAPPLGDQSALDRYTQLMLEARTLLSQREFEKLARMR